MVTAENLEAVPAAHLALEWLERDETPRLFVTDQLSIVWANSAARALLSDRRDFEQRGADLNAVAPDHHKKLAALVRNCGEHGSTVCIPDSGGGHYICRAERVAGDGGGGNISLTLTPTQERKVEIADCRTAFGLTPAENKVLMQLLDGNGAEAIAATNNVSIDTVRSQIRQIYAKLDVASREGLFRRILPYVIDRS